MGRRIWNMWVIERTSVDHRVGLVQGAGGFQAGSGFSESLANAIGKFTQPELNFQIFNTSESQSKKTTVH